MVRNVCKDVLFLSKKAEPATKADMQVAIDLLDTLKANREGCVGLAANMIGVNKAVIAVSMGFFDVAMFNPKIISMKGPYETEEGCLSLSGTRKTTRYKEIEVEFQDMNFETRRAKYTGYIAQIFMHEYQHTQGILI